MLNQFNTRNFCLKSARFSWVAGIVALVVVAVTARNSARIPGEIAAFGFVGAGLLTGIIALAAIAKFGARGLVWQGLAGITINGLILCIAITNIIEGRQRPAGSQGYAQHESAAQTDASYKPTIDDDSLPARPPSGLKKYSVAGMEFGSPFPLQSVDAVSALQRVQKDVRLTPEQAAVAEANARRIQAYAGTQNGFSLSVHGRTLLHDENVLVEAIENQITTTLQSKFPSGLRVNRRVVMVAEREAIQLTIECSIQSKPVRVEHYIILSDSSLWQIQLFGPKESEQYDVILKGILQSLRFQG